MRSPIVIEAKNSVGDVISHAVVFVQQRTTGASAALYVSETGTVPLPNPYVTDANGRFIAWADRGAYVATVSGPGITPFQVSVDPAPGFDGSIDSNWVASSQFRGISTPGTDTTTSATYTTLGSPPEIIYDIPMAANTLFAVGYKALGQTTTSSAGICGFFLNENQIVKPTDNTAPIPMGGSVSGGGILNSDTYISTTGYLGGFTNPGSVNPPTFVTTGMSMGSSTSPTIGGLVWCFIEDAGVYDLSMRWKVAAGTLTIKSRQMWIWTFAF
jgi:hypothetical protein